MFPSFSAHGELLTDPCSTVAAQRCVVHTVEERHANEGVTAVSVRALLVQPSTSCTHGEFVLPAAYMRCAAAVLEDAEAAAVTAQAIAAVHTTCQPYQASEWFGVVLIAAKMRVVGLLGSPTVHCNKRTWSGVPSAQALQMPSCELILGVCGHYVIEGRPLQRASRVSTTSGAWHDQGSRSEISEELSKKLKERTETPTLANRITTPMARSRGLAAHDACPAAG